MIVEPLSIAGVRLIRPGIFTDDRGQFLETWHLSRYREAGIADTFVQDNVSVSRSRVLRGLHYQSPNGQAKLVSALRGRIFDVAVDLRKSSATFGMWTGVELSDGNGYQLYVPAGCAHGFAVLSADAVVSYKCSEYYAPSAERSVLWNDPQLAIAWPIDDPVLSPKDAAAPRLADIPTDQLP